MTSGGSKHISLGKEKLHCLRTGSGSKLLLAFHGYGNSADMFMPFAAHLSEYTIVSIDLPHHGNSSWPESLHLTEQHLTDLVLQLFQQYSCDSISLMGYSMGGRVCLKIAELMPDKIDKIILLASDGLTFNTFYYFVTRTTPGRYLFRSFLSSPNRYMPVINWARKRNMIDASRHKFAMQYLNEAQERHFLLKVWPCMSLLIPDYKKLKTEITQHNIHISVYMGKFDKVIPVNLAERFKEALSNANIELHILNKGHRLIDEDTLPIIAKSLHT
ncbi:MAG TPA: alpha/beta hydrolase [Flavipsychrobacter sp.]|nr:alpha/beta hydrolase [Flavipsychrobacter sp.]